MNKEFDVSRPGQSSRETVGANGVSERVIRAEEADGKKLARNENILSGIAGDAVKKAEADVAKLSATIAPADAAEFKAAAEGAKADFLSAASTVMADPKLDGDAKRQRVEMLYANFVSRVEEAQGKINGKYGKSQADAAKDAKRTERTAEQSKTEFRENFEKRVQESEKEGRLAMARANEAQEAANRPPSPPVAAIEGVR